MKKIIIDVDPGHDDAVAIILAEAEENIDVLGITVVSGNNSLENTLNNTLKICTHLKIDTPVYSGMDMPMVRDRFLSTESIGNVHGETGLDGPVFGEITKKPEDTHAVNYIIDTIKNSKEKITVVATGPLSNIGMSLRLEPKIIENIEEIVIMGGAYGTGNVTPSAEFNIIADPEAAHVVFSSGLPIVMMGLDLTRQAKATKEVVDKIGTVGNKASKLIVDLMEFFTKTQKDFFGWEAPPVHDPTTIAYLIDPSMFEFVECNVQISLEHGMTYGRTVCDMHHATELPRNTKVATKIDFDKFWNLVYENVKKY